MSLRVEPDRWNHNGLTFTGVSIAGVGTCITIPELSVCFDVAQGPPWAIPIRNFFITHGHMDHAAGIPYIISQRCLHDLPPANFYMPTGLIEPMTKIMELWSQIEGFNYDLKFIGVQPEQKMELDDNWCFQPFRTLHRVTSQGYTILRRKKKLLEEFKDRSGPQLEELRRQGVTIEALVETPEVSFTGDTQIEFLDLSPQVKKSRILLMEVTYVDDSRPVDRARTWGHTHLEELLPRLSELECERIILIHLSRRHRHSAVRDLLKSQLSPEDQKRVLLWCPEP